MSTQIPVWKHPSLPTTGTVLEQGLLGSSLEVWRGTARRDDGNDIYRSYSQMQSPFCTCTNARWAYKWWMDILRKCSVSCGLTEPSLTHQRCGTSIFYGPFSQFENLSQFISGKCWPVCCLAYKADGVHLIVQSGIQIKVIGLFLMGLMGVEESMLAAWEALWRWQEAHPMLSTHRFAKWLGLDLLRFRIWTTKPARRVAQGRDALIYYSQQVL